MTEMLIGEINHYFDKLGVAGLDLKEQLRVGDHIHIVGHTTDVLQSVVSMQINHRSIEKAEAGDDVAITVPMKVRVGDKVYLRMYSRPVFEEEEYLEPGAV